jgi:hypothetical protein
MVDRLSNLIGIFANLNLSVNRAEGDDLLGDAYEYLMRHFATESGKRAFLHVGQGEDFSGASRRLDPNRLDFERVQAKGASASS